MNEPSVDPERVRLRRVPELGVAERSQVLSLLDRSHLCHVGIAEAAGPVVIPTLYARVDDELVLHGSVASRLLRAVEAGDVVCVTVTEVDGLVLARSAFETSMRYRSVVVLGRGRTVTDPDERLGALRAISDAVLPGRWEDVRPPDESELRRTRIVAVGIEQCSAKVSDGFAEDRPDDLQLACWAGVVPLRRAASDPVPAPDLAASTPVPTYLSEWVSTNR